MTTQISGDTGVSQCQPNSVSAGDIQTGAIAQADLSTAILPLGVGQTWQTFTNVQRASNTTYTNTTGRPIMVTVSTLSTVGVAGAITLTVGGVNVAFVGTNTSGGAGRPSASTIIPAGATYSANYAANGETLVIWAELG